MTIHITRPAVVVTDPETGIAMSRGMSPEEFDRPTDTMRGISKSRGPITLGQLRELIDRVADWPDTATVAWEDVEGERALMVRKEATGE